VNPYDVDQIADAIRAALEMDPEEKQSRMKYMRRVVQEQNVYSWAASLIIAVSELQVDGRDKTAEQQTIRSSAA
jgi:trehalose-6-phosphate synthase